MKWKLLHRVDGLEFRQVITSVRSLLSAKELA